MNNSIFIHTSKILPALLITAAAMFTPSTQLKAQQRPTKEVSQEVAAQKGSLIRLISSARKVTFKSWDQSKVKVTLEINYDSAAGIRTDQQWFEDLGINIKPFSNRVDIIKTSLEISYSTLLNRKSGSTSLFKQKAPVKKVNGKPLLEEVVVEGYATPNAKQQNLTVTGYGQRKGKLEEVVVSGYRKSSIKSMTIMLPEGCKLDVENKYGDVVIAMNVGEAKLKITNGALDAQDFKDLQLTGNYCTANLGNITKAEIEFNNGTFRALDIKDLDMDSKSSTIEYENGNYLYLRSQNDHYTIDAIDKVDGRKLYGSIKIDKLNNSFDLEGNNVDIKFRNIAPTVSLIKINDRYGDLRLPVKGLTNYYVDFIGNYSSVFAPFQKEVVKEDAKPGEPEVEEVPIKTITDNDGQIRKVNTVRGTLGETAPRHFTSTTGNIKGQHTRIELTCHSCTVDFK